MNDKFYRWKRKNNRSLRYAVCSCMEKAGCDLPARLWLASGASPVKYSSALLFLALFAVMPLFGCTTARPELQQQAVLYQQIDAAAHPVFRDVVEDAVVTHWAPAGTTMEPDAADNADYRLNFDFQVHEKELKDPERIWLMTTMILLTVYPSSCARYEMVLTADLQDRAGQRIKSWRLVEQDTAFLWLFQGGDCSHESDESIYKMAKSMLKDFYRQMVEDVDFSSLAAQVARLPSVYIASKDSEDLIGSVAKIDAPFLNFTFESQDGVHIDYTLTIAFDSVRHDQNFFSMLPRAVLSIWTIGMVSFCPLDETILSAEIQDADGRLLKQYRFTKTRRGSMSSQFPCEPVTYHSDRALAETMLRQLFHKIEQDKIIQKS